MASTNTLSIPNNPRDLSAGVIIVLSGGPIDLTNPIEVRDRMDQLIRDVNSDPYVVANSAGKGLIFKLLPNWPYHIHQSEWPQVCDDLKLLTASPLILVGHSNGGAAVVDLARCLQNAGKNVDLAITCDSVLTLNDNGNPNKVPSNINVNLNSHVIPTPSWWLLPFPFGQPNQRESDGSLNGILNIGLPFPEGGAIAHRDAFYDLAGGDPASNGYKYPEMLLDTIVASLRGATASQIFQLAQGDLQTLANEVRVPINVATTNLNITLQPAGLVHAASAAIQADVAEGLRQSMLDVERRRLKAFPKA
jgi:hypothetical protein